MTYKLEPWIEKIKSLTTVILPDGSSRRYINGSIAANDVFDKHYYVSELGAMGGEITLKLKEAEAPATSWIGEEQQSFF